MRTLNKKHVYDLSELTSEELKELWKCLVKTDSDWEDCGLEELIAYQKTYRLFFNEHNWEWCNISEPTTNAKELSFKLKDNTELTDKEKQIIGGTSKKLNKTKDNGISWSLETENGKVKINKKE